MLLVPEPTVTAILSVYLDQLRGVLFRPIQKTLRDFITNCVPLLVRAETLPKKVASSIMLMN